MYSVSAMPSSESSTALQQSGGRHGKFNDLNNQPPLMTKLMTKPEAQNSFPQGTEACISISALRAHVLNWMIVSFLPRVHPEIPVILGGRESTDLGSIQDHVLMNYRERNRVGWGMGEKGCRSTMVLEAKMALYTKNMRSKSAGTDVLLGAQWEVYDPIKQFMLCY
ncbi:hypothetical protein B0H19DRAFT_1077180 [Mycena capillaripes]|nr:hypothetical protein B0H19DRAFT_1077180 [Mycena capillaripes]